MARREEGRGGRRGEREKGKEGGEERRELRREEGWDEEGKKWWTCMSS